MTRPQLLLSALADIEAAREWYETQRPGLGDRFLDAVDSAVDSVAAFPSACNHRTLRDRREGIGQAGDSTTTEGRLTGGARLLNVEHTVTLWHWEGAG